MHTHRKPILRIFALALLCASLICLGTPAASVEDDFSSDYRASIFYRRLCNVKLTGDQRSDIVNVALSQISYTEGNDKYSLSGLTKGSKNYTEYGRWYDGIYGPDGYNRAAWCAMFVSWCACQAGISSDTLTYHAYTPTGLQWFKDRARAYTRAQVARGTYTPQPGDVIYFKSSANRNEVNHVGIVVRYGDGIIYTVEGNTYPGENSSEGGQVCIKSYSINDTFIRYICSPDYR